MINYRIISSQQPLFIRLMAWIMAISSIASILGGLFLLLQYIVIAKFALYVLALTVLLLRLSRGRKSIDALLLLFLGYLALNVYFSDIPAVFNVKPRFIIFMLIMALFSPIIQNSYFRGFRINYFYCLLYLMIAVSVISFVCYFLGINLMYRNGDFLDDYETSAGHFSGILGHSMMLGPVAGLSSIFLFSKYLRRKKKWTLVLLIMCVGANMFSASRAAFGAMLFALLYEFYTFSNSKKIFIQKTLAFGFVLLITFPVWNSGLSALEKKQRSRNLEDAGLYDSRTAKVENRLAEFYSNPIFGIGYQSVSMYSSDAPNARGDGNIEPGSSWLCILSMTGIVGFLFMITIFKRGVKFAHFAINEHKILLLSSLGFFAIHMLVEGYVYAGGSFLCMILWLVIGVSFDSMYTRIEG